MKDISKFVYTYVCRELRMLSAQIGSGNHNSNCKMI